MWRRFPELLEGPRHKLDLHVFAGNTWMTPSPVKLSAGNHITSWKICLGRVYLSNCASSDPRSHFVRGIIHPGISLRSRLWYDCEQGARNF